MRFNADAYDKLYPRDDKEIVVDDTVVDIFEPEIEVVDTEVVTE